MSWMQQMHISMCVCQKKINRIIKNSRIDENDFSIKKTLAT